jgi:hypothetical protein
MIAAVLLVIFIASLFAPPLPPRSTLRERWLAWKKKWKKPTGGEEADQSSSAKPDVGIVEEKEDEQEGGMAVDDAIDRARDRLARWFSRKKGNEYDRDEESPSPPPPPNTSQTPTEKQRWDPSRWKRDK